MISLQAVAPLVTEPTAPLSETRDLTVLTLTPFYPSEGNPAQGCFVSEPLAELAHQAINSYVIAVQPFYRGRMRAVQSAIASRWHAYFSVPGNLGLPSSGEFLSASLARQIRQLHTHYSFDLIHAHAALPCGAAALSLSKRLGIPFVVTVHGLDAYFAEQAGPRIGEWCKRISKQVYESASTVICISEKVREQVTEIADARTTVVYNGVDPTLFAPRSEKHSSPLILSIGNLIPIKGHASLLRAFSRVSRSAPSWSLEIIGEGTQRRELERLAGNLGIENRVRFLGRQPRSTVADAMRSCAIFALPSTYEALGCVYLEAMACAKPAIGCRGQGIDEIIEHGRNGLLVSPGCESELADVLTMLLGNQELSQGIGSAARQTVLARHTLTHQAEQLAEIYRRCVP